MDLKSYFSSLDIAARDSFAQRCGSTVGVIKNVMYGVRPCATDLAVAIQRESDGAVKRWDLRPNDWWRHWPELIGTPGAPEISEAQPDPTPHQAAAASAPAVGGA